MSDQYNGKERRTRQGWHIEKRITVGEMITIFTVAMSVMLWFAVEDARIGKLEYITTTTTEIQDKRDSAQDEARKAMSEAFSAQITGLGAKIDRVIEILIQRDKGGRGQ